MRCSMYQSPYVLMLNCAIILLMNFIQNAAPVAGLVPRKTVLTDVGNNVNSGEYDLNRRYPIPKFLKTDTNVTVHVGETANLLCSIENLGTRAVVWRHLPDVTPLTIRKYVFTNDDKIRIEHEFESQDWRLIISNVQKTNAGEYECQVASRDTSFRQHFYLNVLDAVADTKHYVEEAINIYGPKHVNTGESFEVHCNATGVDFPPDEIDWFINGFKIKTDFDRGVIMDKSVSLKTKSIESTIHIEHAQMKDAGDYTCRVSTGLVKTTEVNVLYMDKNNNSKRVIVPESVPPQEEVKGNKPHNGARKYIQNFVFIFILLDIVIYFDFI